MATGYPFLTALSGTLEVADADLKADLREASGADDDVGTATQTAIDAVSNAKAAKGANSDITSISGLTTPLSVPQGGTGVASITASRALVSDGDGKLATSAATATEVGHLSGVTSAIQTQITAKAAKGANSDITSLSGLTTPLSVAQGGTGQDTLAELKTAMSFVKADVGLGNVDDTSDANKPISTATQEALDALDTDKLDVSALDSTLAGKSSASTDISTFFGLNESNAVIQTPALRIQRLTSFPIDAVSGTVGTGSDDTAAWAEAHAEALSRGCAVELTHGKTYLVDKIDFSTISNIVAITCKGKATLKKRTNDGNPLLALSSSGYGGYVPGQIMSGVIFDADAKADYAVLAYHLARWLFERCVFKGANVAGHAHLGGVGTRYSDCEFSDNTGRGLVIDKFSTNYPNLHSIYNSRILDNDQAGLFFDNGRFLICDNVDVEHNGTTSTAGHAGIWVGDNVGAEDAGIGSIGLVLNNAWIEDNGGAAAVRFGSGHNIVNNGYFKANRDAPHLHIEGGTYVAENCVFGDTGVNIQEEVAVGSGNRIIGGTRRGTITISSTKTTVDIPVGWTSYTPSVAPQAGSITTSSSTGAYRREGSVVKFTATATIATNGTGASWLKIGLPSGLPVASGKTFIIPGLDTGASSKTCIARLTAGATTALVQTAAALSYPAADGSIITISGEYETDAA